MEADRSFMKRVREPESDDKLEFDLAEVKRLRDDLLADRAFDDDETGDNNPESAATRDLDSFMGSLQEEIVSGASSSHEMNFVDLTSEPGESDSDDNNPKFAATRDLDLFMRSLQEEMVLGASSLQEVNLIDLTSESAESYLGYNNPDSFMRALQKEIGPGAVSSQEVNFIDLTSEPGESDSGDKNPKFATTRDLDSSMRSLQEEIVSGTSSSQEVNFIDLTSESGESLTELGFLLGASHDELGIPRSNDSNDNKNNNINDNSNKVVINLESDWDRVDYDSSELTELWDYGDHVPACYDSFEFGGGERYKAEGGAGVLEFGNV